MAASLLLIRHGRSGHVHRGWIDAEGVRRWRAAYDEAGIAADDAPPAELVARVARADLVVASDFPRAVASAERLAPGRVPLTSDLLRESPLEIPAWWPSRLPLGGWGALISLQWGYQILRGTDASPDERARAAAAAQWLAGLARGRSAVAVVTHGVFRRLLAAQLLATGWHPTPGRRGYRHWSVWHYQRNDSVALLSDPNGGRG